MDILGGKAHVVRTDASVQDGQTVTLPVPELSDSKLYAGVGTYGTVKLAINRVQIVTAESK